MTTPICTLDATGIHKPLLADCLNYLNSGFQGVWGTDIYIDPDSQDGQQIGIFAAAYDDANSMAVAVYNSFRPADAIGAGLSSLVKINGVRRDVPTNSTAPLIIGGRVGTIINNGVVLDQNSVHWDLPAQVVIPPSGAIQVTVTCELPGEIAADAHSITTIATPVPGWQTVDNPIAASVGEPVENDGQLCIRQQVSTELPSRSNIIGITGGVLDLPGVTACKVWENDTTATDHHEIPANSIAVVAVGGNPTDIAGLIAAKKTDGCGTFGTTSVTLVDPYGVPHVYSFSVPNQIDITGTIVIRPGLGYTYDTEANIKSALVKWIDGLGIGVGFGVNDAIAIINPSRAAGFHVVSAAFARDGGLPGAAYVPMAFNERPVSQFTYITISLTSD
jgi:uncharacterized phage protein gp47/JayE